ncbi:glycosyltransferase family 4 protein [Haladaptatus salinisoli]|uniref:glycosyltransferase family 4 protein n=1 Tax=Haladaptatus salinisoli TaxID=2884876 RepID=UPI001D0AD840|nr:glycosyltransferase family 4 protein [Haladaptatus salinisoli]
MRVLQVVHALPTDTLGGTELYTAELAERLDREHEVRIAAPSDERAAVGGVPVLPLPAAETQGDDGLSGTVRPDVDARVAEVLDSFDPDVVHLQHFKGLSSSIPTLCAERDVACVATLHDFWTRCHREQLYRPEGTLCSGPESVAKCADCYRAAAKRTKADGGSERVSGRRSVDDRYRVPVERRRSQLSEALAATDLLISPSTFLRETFVEYGTDPDDVVTCRNGIAVERFEDTGFDPAEPLRFGYAGRIAESKGVHLLLEAFRRVEGDVRLDIFGEFDPETRYHSRLARSADDRVRFHGRYDDKASPYRAMDVLVLPSLWYENSPLVIQEAFASGVPVVTGDVGGMAELVDDGRDGLTFEVGNADSLAETLRTLAESPVRVERLRRGVEEPKSLDEHVAEVERLYARRGRGG